MRSRSAQRELATAIARRVATRVAIATFAIAPRERAAAHEDLQEKAKG